MERVGRISRDRPEPGAESVRIRPGVEQRGRVRVTGLGEDGIRRLHLNDLPCVHHTYPVAKLCSEIEIVSNKKNPDFPSRTQLIEYRDNLSLYGHIQGCRGLIRYQHLRFRDEFSRNHDPLEHPA